MVEIDDEEVGSESPSTSPATKSNSIEMEAPSSRSTCKQPSRKQSTATKTAAAATEGEDEMELKYGAEHVIRLFVPVSICMALVVATMKMMEHYSFESKSSGAIGLTYTPFVTTEKDETSDRLLGAVGNALIIIAFVVVMTFVLILLYKFECYKVIHGWLFSSSVLLLGLISLLYVSEFMAMGNWCASYPTVLFVLFNYAAMGIMCIHWKGPLLMQQAYLISVSALMALIWIKMLPDFTVWALLVVISVWDLIAVLCPGGPLNMLVKLSQERDEPIFPALIYSTNTTETGKKKEKKGESREEEEGEARGGAGGEGTTTSKHGVGGSSPGTKSESEDNGVKLGLGDFVFYSILMGKATKESADWNTLLACYIAILMGLCATLLLLAVFKKALPALPISIAAGLVFYFSTSNLITPFTTQLVSHQLTY